MEYMTKKEALDYVISNPDKKFFVRPVSLFGNGVFEQEGENRARLIICELSVGEAAAIASGKEWLKKYI